MKLESMDGLGLDLCVGKTVLFWFCKRNYGVTFQMFEKIHVKGKRKHPIYNWLSSSKLNGWNDKSPTWNFCKYLIDRNGNLIDYFPSKISPLDTSIINQVIEN